MTLSDLTPTQLARLAVEAGTSAKYLKHIIDGRRSASVNMAARLEAAGRRLRLALGRETMSADCRACPYLKACRKETK
jgi:hypothetical protein